ncbi:hypothetical protein [Massilia sp. Root351]|uniref:hypothetical protein n=1 Tax=Massilia sp. Root351 TaxID=1736522 RepID=UPI0012F6494F|nr:hypothetical protein [Massilia sp. Root351]
MSNPTLVARIAGGLEDVQLGKIAASTFAEIVRNNGRALEAMPYDLIKEMENLAHDFDIAQWYDEDGCLPELESVLVRTQAWLAMLPQDA